MKSGNSSPFNAKNRQRLSSGKVIRRRQTALSPKIGCPSVSKKSKVNEGSKAHNRKAAFSISDSNRIAKGKEWSSKTNRALPTTVNVPQVDMSDACRRELSRRQ